MKTRPLISILRKPMRVERNSVGSGAAVAERQAPWCRDSAFQRSTWPGSQRELSVRRLCSSPGPQCGHARRCACGAGDGLAVAVEQFHGQTCGPVRPGRCSCWTFARHFERGIAVLRVEVGLDEEIAYVDLRRAPEGDVAEDAAEAPHVLVFQVAAGAEAIDLDGDHVLARA